MNKTYFYILLAVIVTGIVSVFACQNKSGFIKPQSKTETVVTTPPLPETLPSFPPPPTPPPPPPLDFSKAEVLAFPDNKLDTSDWQTYRNEEFGFEVKHPRGWEVASRAPNDREVEPLMDREEGFWRRNDAGGSFFIARKDRPAPNGVSGEYNAGTRILVYKKPPEDFTKEASLSSVYIRKYVSINGAYGAVFAWKKDGEWTKYNKNLVIFKDNLVFDFADSEGIYTSIFQQILLSFKFTR